MPKLFLSSTITLLGSFNEGEKEALLQTLGCVSAANRSGDPVVYGPKLLIENSHTHCTVFFANEHHCSAPERLIVYWVTIKNSIDQSEAMLSEVRAELAQLPEHSRFMVIGNSSGLQIKHGNLKRAFEENIPNNVIVYINEPSSVQNALLGFIREQQWQKIEEAFKTKLVAAARTANILDHVQTSLLELKSGWERGTPDFVTFSNNCNRVFRERLSAYRCPPVKDLLSRFILGMAIGMLLSVGIMLALAASIFIPTAILWISGILSVSVGLVNLQNALLITVAAGGIGGIVNSFQLFRPADMANTEVSSFVKDLQSTIKLT